MRNSSLLKWANNKNNKTKDEKGNKNWLHSPETLTNSQVVYLVKFLGCTEVDKPKGIDVVKQGIQKLKFNQQLRKSEGASKTPKAELIISCKGVSIQEPKSKKVLHQYPLHKISYCADDKAEKRFFSFISKEGDSDKHTCFVFVSDKLAEEITLTIGQAFELAYKKFLDTSGKDLEAKKQFMTLQKRVALLENETAVLKKRLQDLSNLNDVKNYMAKNQLTDICYVESKANDNVSTKSSEDNTKDEKIVDNNKQDNNELICLDNNTENGEIDGFTLDDLNDEDFNPRAGSSDEDEALNFNPRNDDQPPPQSPAPTAPAPIISPPPQLPPRDPAKVSQPSKPATTGNTFTNNNELHSDVFSMTSKPQAVFDTNNPFAAFTPPSNPVPNPASDPFGMSSFDTPNKPTQSTFDAFSAFGSTPPLKANMADTWAAAPAINKLSLDELDPLKK